MIWPSWILKLIAVAGSLGACYAFLKLIYGDWSHWRRKPRLKIEFDPITAVRPYHYPDTGWLRNVGTVEVRNKGKMVAKRCVGVLRVIDVPPGVQLLDREFTLHWAGIDYSFLTSGAEPVDIGQHERRRLDLVFTQLEPVLSPGCWVAIPIALSAPMSAAQAHLPPAKYTCSLKVECENGKGDSLKFSLVSPEAAQGLEMTKR